jgi:hypothetical protein
MDRFRKRMWRTARAIGLPCSPRTFAEKECPWDGKVLHGHARISGQGICDWWHEIGHFLVAPEKALKLRGWGQGTVYDGTEGGPEILDEADEPDASAVGIWCQQVFGLDPEGARVHAEFHSWIASNSPSMYKGSREKSWQQHLADMLSPVRDRVEQRLSRAGLPTPWSTP